MKRYRNKTSMLSKDSVGVKEFLQEEYIIIFGEEDWG